MNYIQNVSAVDVGKGHHMDCGENSMLIRIGDVGKPYFPPAVYNFKETHEFEFADLDVGLTVISDSQAEQIVALLQKALDNRMNVVVHCVAGIARSGAVAVVGEMLGFHLVDGFRIPNVTVKLKLMKAAGFLY